MNQHDWRLLKHEDKYVYKCADCGATVEAAKDEDSEAVSQRFITLQKCDMKPPGVL